MSFYSTNEHMRYLYTHIYVTFILYIQLQFNSVIFIYIQYICIYTLVQNIKYFITAILFVKENVIL